jgi:hypothetical protein
MSYPVQFSASATGKKAGDGFAEFDAGLPGAVAEFVTGKAVRRDFSGLIA